jgi:hypothetical protein
LEGSKKVRTGAEFTFKDLEVTGSLGYEHSASRERFHETITHDEIYHSKEVKRKFDLKKGESMNLCLYGRL